jgi:hypothetical protein
VKLALALVVLCGCAHHATHADTKVKTAIAPAVGEHVRLAAVMWPTKTAIITCTRRLDDAAEPEGVAGPCHRLEVGETERVKVVSWATLGRFDDGPPDDVPKSFGGRCRLEITRGERNPLHEATLTWVTPTKRVKLDDWMPSDDPETVEADQFTIETSFAPEGSWLAVLHVAIGLGEGERIVQIPHAEIIPVPACE